MTKYLEESVTASNPTAFVPSMGALAYKSPVKIIIDSYTII